MFIIKYDIDLNDTGRPHIVLPEDYEQNPEDRFFALEIARYILQDLLKRKKDTLDSMTVNAMDEAERLLGQLGDSVAEILYENMKAIGEMDIMMDKFFHINVKSIEERDALPDKDIIYNGKIFDRVEGLLVQVNKFYGDGSAFSPYLFTQHDFKPIVEMYKLVDGITNEHWVRLSTEDINKRWTRND